MEENKITKEMIETMQDQEPKERTYPKWRSKLPPKWAIMRMDIMYRWNTQTYLEMLLEGTLKDYLIAKDQSDSESFATLVDQIMKKEEKLTPTFRAEHPMEWVGLMNMTRMQAEEIVKSTIWEEEKRSYYLEDENEEDEE